MLSPTDWEHFLSGYADTHLLQTAAWGDLKSAFGWKARRIAGSRAGAQVLFRRALPGLNLAYIPKGPVGVDWQDLWPVVDRLCRQEQAFLLKVEPDGWLDNLDLSQHPGLTGFRPSLQPIQPPRTLLVDLTGTEEEILARMKQKTRYNIHLAEKKGVTVRASDDLDAYQRLALATAERDRFGVHSRAYYQAAYDLFHPRGECELILAEAQGELLAALMVFRRGRHTYYLYGASSDVGRNLMPTYLLQWEAMRWARACGCVDYDLWGVPDAPEDWLEAQFTTRSDGLWGVYRFKRGFGGRLVRAPGAFDRVYNPPAYALYRLWARLRRGED